MRFVLGLAVAFPLVVLSASSYSVSTVVGGDSVGDGQAAVLANLNDAQGVAIDSAGILYIADPANHRVRRVSNGIIETVAGTGFAGFAGDGGPARLAVLNAPYGVAAAPDGSLYIADLGNHRVRRVTRDGIISTAASGLSAPRNVAVAPDGTVAISDFDAQQVVRITASGALAVIAGELSYPAGIAFDANGALYIAESGAHRIRRVSGGVITTVAGNDQNLRTPTGVAVSPSGDVWIADSNNRRIVVVPAGGGLRVAAGLGSSTALATLDSARDVALGPDQAAYIADGRRVRKLTVTGAASVAAGDGAFGFRGDGGLAVDALLNGPSGVAVAPDGALYVTDERNHRLRRVSPNGVITTIAGTGVPGFGYDGLTALTTPIDTPGGVTVDSGNTVWFVEQRGNRVRRLGATGVLGLVTADVNRPAFALTDPNGTLYVSDSGSSRVARRLPGGALEALAALGVAAPRGLTVDAAGNLYVADTGNNRIRRLSPSGDAITLPMPAGIDLAAPAAVLALPSGALVIADTGHHRILEWKAGAVTVAAGDGQQGFAGDNGPALAARFNTPVALAADSLGNLYVADQLNNRIRKLTPHEDAAVSDPVIDAAAEIKVTNAASGATGPIAPGEILSIYGVGFGPSTGTAAAAGLPLELNGVEVLFDGQPARLYYTQDQQINVQAPYALASKLRTNIEVRYRGETRAVSAQLVARAAPALFSRFGVALALNQDGTLHSQSNPAAPGSIVVLFATGEGQTAPEGVDGRPHAWPPELPLLPVAAAIGSKTAVILYAGGAPGFVGLLQINVRVPDLPPGLATAAISVGSARSPAGVGIWVR